MTARQIAQQIKDCAEKGGIIYVIGNGGSSSEADHMASELLTHGYPSISLCHSATITAIANDYDFSEVFADQIQTLGKKGDILIGLTTSGKSENINLAYIYAKNKGLSIIDWPRSKSAKTPKETAKLQEEQLKLMHKVYLMLI